MATARMVLAALGHPVGRTGLFTPDARKVRGRLRVALTGMSLDERAGLLEAHGARVRLQRAGTFDAGAFRADVQQDLATPGDHLIENYQRAVLGQPAAGHHSPLAAYDADTDSVLILDTAAHHYPPTWVPLERLVAAMATPDSETGRQRGYLSVAAAAR